MEPRHSPGVRAGVWFAIAVLQVAVPPVRAGDSWSAAEGLLMTRWAKEVSPSNALPDYPRPQRVRPRWLNLNGLWDYAVAARYAARPQRYDGRMLVPFPVEAPLSGVMKPLSPDHRLWCRRDFTVPADWAGQRVLLHFGAVDWEATVFVDGRELGSHRGGYDGFSFDITDFVKAGETHQLTVSVWDPTDTAWQLHGKQSLHPGGCSYSACSGIWQTVWLEPVPESHIDGLEAVPDLEEGRLSLTVNARIVPGPLKVEAVAMEGDRPVGSVAGGIGDELTPQIQLNLVKFFKAKQAWVTTELKLPVPHARPWSPDDPFLYDLVVELKDGDGRTVDRVTSYFGMRSVRRGQDAQGAPRMLLNGRPILMPGALDQGYWPDGIYVAPTDEALRFDIEFAKRLGLNAVRKHVKVEPQRWYYWADRLGLMVLQDMPTGNCGDPATDRPRSPEAADQWRLEVGHVIGEKINHPSIVCWNLFNEAFGGFDYARHAAWAKRLDPSRLVNESSGFPWHGGGDVLDGHGGIDFKETRAVSIISEAGTPSVGVAGHQWPHAWSYGSYDPKTGRTMDFLAYYNKNRETAVLPALTPEAGVWLTRQVGTFFGDFLRNTPRSWVSGLFYCQLVDVETECNGLISFDRAVPKVDAGKVAGSIRTNTPPLPAKGDADGRVPSPVEGAARPAAPNPLPFSYVEGQTAPRSELRDPCILREGGTYYLVFTLWPFRNREEPRLHEPDQGGSPGIALYTSSDLKTWAFSHWLVRSSELPEDCPYKNRFWAPEIHKINGRFYLIFTADNWLKKEYNPAGSWGTAGHSFIGVSDAVTGPYAHITYVPGGTCDMTLFGDRDGQIYAIKPKGDVYLQKIDLSGLPQGKIAWAGEETRAVACSNADIGLAASPEYLEGPWLERIGGAYYLFYAEIFRDKTFPDWLGYRTNVAVADRMDGPWRKDPRGQVFFGGHLAAFDGPDGRKWFSYRWEKDDRARGRLCIDPVSIDEQGRVQARETLSDETKADARGRSNRPEAARFSQARN